MKKYFWLFFLILFAASSANASENKVSVAVAANFIQPFKEIAADFEQKTGVKVEVVFSSTGNLYSQIKNGAPYDIFLAADEKRPDLLKKEGWTNGVFIYARGKAVLWSADKSFCTARTWQEALKKTGDRKIAIANPDTAPYGAAARTALQTAGLWGDLKSKLVMAQDIAQAFHYAETSAAEAAFCAASAVVTPEGRKGCYYEIPQAPEIVQAGCFAKKPKDEKCTELFVLYLISGQADKVKAKYGYK